MKHLNRFQRRILLETLDEMGNPIGSLAYDLQRNQEVLIADIGQDENIGFMVLVSGITEEYWVRPDWLTPLQCNIEIATIED